MKYFEKHNWDVNIWAFLQILGVLIGLSIVAFAPIVNLLISVVLFFTVVAMLFRLRIRPYRNIRIFIIVLTAFLFFIRITFLPVSGFNIEFSSIGGAL